MKVRNLYYSLVVSFLIFFQGCGEVDERDVIEVQKESSLLSKENYISLAKYHFSKRLNINSKNKSTKIESDSKFRSYVSSQDREALLKITYTAPFDKIESMRLESGDRYIILEVDNNFITISLFEGNTLLESNTKNKIEFNSFGLKESGGVL